MPFKLIALVLPLSLDTFAVSAAFGAAGLSRRERWRLSLLTQHRSALDHLFNLVIIFNDPGAATRRTLHHRYALRACARGG